MRDGNPYIDVGKYHASLSVYRLPMRDGNPQAAPMPPIPAPRVYRLPMRDGNNIRGVSLHWHGGVYRLPMRDGNRGWIYLEVFDPAVFIDYL